MPKPTRGRANNAVLVPSRPADAGPSASLDTSEVARRAFELYCARGGGDGHDLDDWLTAERELRSTVSVTVA